VVSEWQIGHTKMSNHTPSSYSSIRNPFARGFRELIVYQRQRELARRVFEATKGFPKDEMFSLTDQIRRSSRAVGAAIAEAWGKRRYPRHFVSKLTDADSEQLETQHWLESARDAGYLQNADCQTLLQLCDEIGRMLGSMINKAEQFNVAEPLVLKEDAASEESAYCSLTTADFVNR
jgi:four helix bundle protein